MMNCKLNIYTLTSELHNEQAVTAATQEFLTSLGIDYELKGNNFADYGSGGLSMIYVRTGGTEGIFLRMLPELRNKSRQPFYLLTSGKSNSLAASMEILSYLQQHGLKGEIIHGSVDYIVRRLQLLARVENVYNRLRGTRLGVVDEPSDWLISSHADKGRVKELLGIELVDIPMTALLDGIRQQGTIYEALKNLVERNRLQGFTLRCFDLLTAVKDTGCMALAKLNAEGFVAGCEGDVPAMLSMMITRALTGVSGFQANPANINPETGELLFAHCTIPLDMVERYELDTHYESGIGTGVRGYMKPGPVTILKVSGDLSRSFVAEGELIENQAKPDLCRTQQVIRLSDKQQAAYFLTNPIGNHHIVMPGHHGEELQSILGVVM
jgi:L-fucose isomerase-like protein